MGERTAGTTETERAKETEEPERPEKIDAEKKAELRKFYDCQVAEKVEKKRLEVEMQKKFRAEQEQELALWKKKDDEQTAKAKQKAMEEKALRDEQIMLANDQKVKSLEQEVRDHERLIGDEKPYASAEGEKNKKALQAKRAEFFRETRAQTLELQNTRKQTLAQQRSEEASANEAYVTLLKQYEKQRQEERLAKTVAHWQECENIRKKRAEAVTASRKATMKRDMEQLLAREAALDYRENRQLVEAQEKRSQHHKLLLEQISEIKEQKSRELQAWREAPKPRPGDAGFSTSKKLLARDLGTGHAWNLSRSEDEVLAKRREQQMQNQKDLEAQITARGRPFPGLNICPKVPREPELTPKVMERPKVMPSDSNYLKVHE